jgi:alpha-ketoglutarate-dependent taurine dioxygenase
MNNQNLISYSFHYSEFDKKEIKEKLYNHLLNDGYVLIKKTGLAQLPIEESRQHYHKICTYFGEPMSHDAKGTIIWDIKNNPESVSFVKTYSEHNHEAELHTDSQYSFNPEDYFGLLTLKAARCGGGQSYLLSLKDILTEFRALPNGEKYEQTLRNSNYPFIVPNVFKKDTEKEFEFNFGPMLRDNEIRFRIDTMEKALIVHPEYATPEMQEAYKALKELILQTNRTQKFFLEDDDLILINNKTMLHGRSEFTDSNRHLLRIRMRMHESYSFSNN